LKFKVNAKCSMCGENVHHEVELEGDTLSWFREQLEVTGIAPISVDHGDHVMVVYLDKHGYARSSYTYPIMREEVAGEQWTEIQASLIKCEADVIFANWKEKKYCVPHWSIDFPHEKVLPQAEAAKIVSLEGREFWVLASGDNRMIIAKRVGWQRSLFQMMQEMLSQATLVEPDIVMRPAVQAILASIVSSPFTHTSNSSSIFADLRKKVRATRALKLLNDRIAPELVSLLEKLESYDSLEECLFSADVRQISLLIKNYRSLRNMGVIAIV